LQILTKRERKIFRDNGGGRAEMKKLVSTIGGGTKIHINSTGLVTLKVG
jgi:hypothetical protein